VSSSWHEFKVDVLHGQHPSLPVLFLLLFRLRFKVSVSLPRTRPSLEAPYDCLAPVIACESLPRHVMVPSPPSRRFSFCSCSPRSLNLARLALNNPRQHIGNQPCYDPGTPPFPLCPPSGLLLRRQWLRAEGGPTPLRAYPLAPPPFSPPLSTIAPVNQSVPAPSFSSDWCGDLASLRCPSLRRPRL